MTIYDRIDKAMLDISKHKFKKDKWVGKWVDQRVDGKLVGKIPDPSDRNGYWVISITQILDVVQEVHAKHGIKCIFEGPYFDANNSEKRITLTTKDRYGNDSQVTIANGHYNVRIIGEGPDDMIETRAQCEAKDSAGNDKLGNKLLTNAMRSLYRSMYSIDGDDSKDPEEVGAVEPEVQEDRKTAIQADRFFRTGAEVAADAQEEPVADEWAVKVKACKKSILDWIKEDPTQRTTNEILVHYVNAHGTMSTWEGGTVVQCYKELRSAGVEGLPEVAL